jgi:hypothetical protein
LRGGGEEVPESLSVSRFKAFVGAVSGGIEEGRLGWKTKQVKGVMPPEAA